MDICNGTQKDDDYQGFPKRDGSLVRKKRLQWEREKANKETWFPFGSPGGGAPNKKFEAVNYELVVEPKLSPEVNVGIDCNPNNNKNQLGSSATSSDSASFRMKLIEKDEERTIMKHVSVNTSTIPQSLKHASSVDRSVDMSNHGLPGVGENRVHPVQCTTAGEHPLFAAFQPINHAYHVPVVFAHFAPHMSADQYNSISDCCNGNFIACPIQFMPKTSNSGLQENSGLNGKLPLDASGGSSSYAEFCSNHLPLWHDGYMGVSSTPKATIKVEDHSNIPSLTNTQPLAVVRPLIPIVSMLPSAASSSSYNFEQHLTCSEDDVAAYTQNSLNSFVSLESLPEQQQSAEFHARDRAKQFEQFCDAQVSEKRKLLAQQAEEKRLENIRVENERKMFDEIEEQRKLEEEKLRSVAETRKLETESALVASLEKARREAALLKKAKLYKHVLEGCEEGTEKSLLGDDDVENDRILYEVECLERQKKINMKVWKEKENLSKLKKEKNGGSSERHLSKVLFNSASDADRPKDTANSVINGVLPCSSAGHTSVDFVRNRIGRQSLRLPTKKIQRMPAADEDLCSNTESKRCVQISKTNTLNDEIQVLSQRRILPTGTKKAFSEKQISFESVNSNDGAASSMPSAMNYSRSFDYEKLSSDIVELGKAAVSELSSNCGADRLQAQSINTTTANGDKAPPVGSVEAKKMKNHRQCSTSGNAKGNVFISTSLKRKTDDDRQTLPDRGDASSAKELQNPLFEPVRTRIRQRMMETISLDSKLAKSIGGQNSTPAVPSGISHPHNKCSIITSDSMKKLGAENGNAGENERVDEKKLRRKAEQHSFPNGVITEKENESMLKSHFLKTLANSGLHLNRPFQDISSPEIRRKGETSMSTFRLRTSSSSLAADDTRDAGRVSPISPLIERFNSTAVQYRSFNLKKTSERNQKILDHLTNVRSLLKKKQEQMERDFGWRNSSGGSIDVPGWRTPQFVSGSDDEKPSSVCYSNRDVLLPK